MGPARAALDISARVEDYWQTPPTHAWPAAQQLVPHVVVVMSVQLHVPMPATGWHT
jgi:hypothetical protein